MQKNRSKSNTYSMPQRMVDASICAYSIKSPDEFKPESKYWDPIQVKGQASTFLAGSDDIDAGFIATTEDDWVVLSFRGTLSTHHNWETFIAFLKDWWQDDETKKVHWDFEQVHLGRVEKGFHKAIMKLWPQMKVILDKVDWSTKQGIQITGHSKGAAMTFLAAAMVKICYPQAKEINVHAFAAPLVAAVPKAGTTGFAQWYQDNRLDTTTTRYQRIDDIVPFLPPAENWNILHNLTWHTAEGLAIYSALELLGISVHDGYEEVGSMVFLPGDPPSTGTPMHGQKAILSARNAIINAVGYGYGDKIAAAHSVACSYWPAVFQTPNNDSECQ